ncbi:MAG: hypothetical protein AB8B76_13740 [Congregibacter sp.]
MMPTVRVGGEADDAEDVEADAEDVEANAEDVEDDAVIGLFCTWVR